MSSTSNVEQGKAFVRVLAAVLARLVATNDSVSPRRGRPHVASVRASLCLPPPPPSQSGAAAAAEVTRFHALRPPSISVYDYLQR